VKKLLALTFSRSLILQSRSSLHKFGGVLLVRASGNGDGAKPFSTLFSLGPIQGPFPVVLEDVVADDFMLDMVQYAVDQHRFLEQQDEAVLEALDPLVGVNLELHPPEYVPSDSEDDDADDELEYSDDEDDQDQDQDDGDDLLLVDDNDYHQDEEQQVVLQWAAWRDQLFQLIELDEGGNLIDQAVPVLDGGIIEDDAVEWDFGVISALFEDDEDQDQDQDQDDGDDLLLVDDNNYHQDEEQQVVLDYGIIDEDFRFAMYRLFQERSVPFQTVDAMDVGATFRSLLRDAPLRRSSRLEAKLRVNYAGMC
jgi:hypothetical protein